jgi:hypothetical protein
MRQRIEKEPSLEETYEVQSQKTIRSPVILAYLGSPGVMAKTLENMITRIA